MSTPTPSISDSESAIYERQYVHEVYDQIAPHFSSTRYKPWPVVEQFLKDIPEDSVGLDVGCGNGKYLAVNPKIFILASDRSESLVRIANKHKAHTAIVADNLSLPHPKHFFDFAISIAVIHHLSTPARRIEAIKAIVETLRRPSTRPSVAGGKALIYVWALEQKNSRRGWGEDDEQDVMVPWVMKQKDATNGGEGCRTFQRYYHLYRKGELEDNIVKAGGSIVKSGYEKDNWWAIATAAAVTAT